MPTFQIEWTDQEGPSSQSDPLRKQSHQRRADEPPGCGGRRPTASSARHTLDSMIDVHKWIRGCGTGPIFRPTSTTRCTRVRSLDPGSRKLR